MKINAEAHMPVHNVTGVNIFKVLYMRAHGNGMFLSFLFW